MPVEVKVIENRIPALVARVESVSRAAVKSTADNIAQTARRYAPVLTGELRDSIHSESIATGKEAEVQVDADYGGYVEFGTYKMVAQPFLGPAIDFHEEELAAEIFVAFEGSF